MVPWRALALLLCTQAGLCADKLCVVGVGWDYTEEQQPMRACTAGKADNYCIHEVQSCCPYTLPLETLKCKPEHDAMKLCLKDVCPLCGVCRMPTCADGEAFAASQCGEGKRPAPRCRKPRVHAAGV